MVVITITFLSIIFGELVPKRIGLMYPEASRASSPGRWNGSRSSRGRSSSCCRGAPRARCSLLGIRGGPDRSVTEEEIAASLEEGLDAGVIEAQEHQMVRNVFRLDDRQVGSMMIPRAEIVWLEATRTAEDVLRVIGDAGAFALSGVPRRPRRRARRDHRAEAAAAVDQGQGRSRSTEDLQPPVFVPETLSGMELLEHFRASSAQIVFVVDEYGEVQGMITVRDVLEAITGEFSTETDADSWAVQRDDGSWLFDGLIPTPELKDRLDLKELPEEDRGRYNTLAGMIMLLLGRLPEDSRLGRVGRLALRGRRPRRQARRQGARHAPSRPSRSRPRARGR